MLWINNNKITNVLNVPNDAVDTKPYILDGDVRDFTSWAEARSFAAQTTDYIGNLAGAVAAGTWVRFDNAGINILGEDHTYITLDYITTAVRSRSFIYERFATDTLPLNSAFRNAYVAENAVLLGQFGVALDSDLAAVGGESLLPKIADTVAELVPYFAKTMDMTGMTSGNGRYIGKPDQRYVKIGWAWAKDLVGHASTPAEIRLAGAVNTHQALLDPFITTLPVDGYLGDPLVQGANADKYQPLLNLCQEYVPVMIERAHADPKLTPQERQILTNMPTGTVEEQQKMFGLWRNLYFAKATEAAAVQGVRYAGMGEYHRLWLINQQRVPASAHTYDVTKVGFNAFITRTDMLRNS